MADILQSLINSPLLAALGALLLLTIILVPIALRLAGLSGQQIVDLLVTTGRMFIDLVRAFRNENHTP